jgi:hypothetical protein
MATTTPNYGWPVPTSTDFVKDGATAIADLGDAIDATVFGLPSGGLTLISTTTATAAASTIITGLFSSTYNNYRVMISGTGSVNGATVTRLQLRTGTTTETTNYQAKIIASATGTSTGIWQTGSYQTSGFPVGYFGNAAQGSASVDIFNPFIAANTSYHGTATGVQSGSDLYGIQVVGGYHGTAASYDQLVVSISSGDFTGVIKVYGYL